jgi:hypothetical protein
VPESQSEAAYCQERAWQEGKLPRRESGGTGTVLGECYSPKIHPIFLWYNLRKDGKIDEENVEPNPSSMIRIRYLKVDYFMSVMRDYVESGYREFPDEFLKDDYMV